VTRPFRFIAAMPPPDGTVAEWLDAVHRIEDLGFDAVSVSEHLTGGWQFDALTAMTAILSATSRLRVLSLVLANDMHNPVLLHRAAATMDALGGGRLNLGLGAGWMERDYRAAGVPFASTGERIERLGEAVTIIKGLFRAPIFSFAGRYYTIRNAEGLPRPVQLPNPPILIGGGGRGILGLAAREADIIGVHARMGGTGLGPEAVRDLGEGEVAAKVTFVRDALQAASRSLETVELQWTIYECRITDDPRAEAEGTSAFAQLLRADPELMARSPAVLVGSLSSCVERLLELRERFGFNVIKLSGDARAAAPIVRALAGR
jgi:probable F420-dependent oxidoreductase